MALKAGSQQHVHYTRYKYTFLSLDESWAFLADWAHHVILTGLCQNPEASLLRRAARSAHRLSIFVARTRMSVPTPESRRRPAGPGSKTQRSSRRGSQEAGPN
jgi:hypothetical protein